jgi:hypothetical protein
MAKASNKRILKRLKKKSEWTLAKHIETLGAGFCHEYGLKASEAQLQVTKDPDGAPVYRFTKYEPLQVNDLHPDIKYLVDLCTDLLKAYNLKDGTSVKDGFRMMQELFDGFDKGESSDDECAAEQNAESREFLSSELGDTAETAS